MSLQRGTWRDDIKNDFLGYDPPDETVYTGISASNYCLCFGILSVLHMVVLFILKWNVSSDFRNSNIFDQTLHVAESTNFPYSMYDWDDIKSGGPNELYIRMKSCRIEIILNIIINMVVSMLLLTPLTYLCKYYKHMLTY